MVLEGYILTSEAAQLTGYSEYYMRQLCRTGRVECVKVGRTLLVLQSSIEAHKAQMDALGTQKFTGKGKGEEKEEE